MLKGRAVLVRRFKRTDDIRVGRVNTANTSLTAANVRELSDRMSDSELWGAFWGAERANDRELREPSMGRCSEATCSANIVEPLKDWGSWLSWRVIEDLTGILERLRGKDLIGVG